MKLLFFISLAFLLVSCSPKVLNNTSSHYESIDTTLETDDFDAVKPESNSNYDIPLEEICGEIQRENDSLREKVYHLKTSLQASGSTQPKTTATLTRVGGKATLTCHEDEWRQKYEDAIKRTTITKTVRDTIRITIPICQSKFHGFTEYWFYGTVMLGLLISALMVLVSRSKHLRF